VDKIIWLSDIHLLPKDKLLFGLDPSHYLQSAITYISTYHADAAVCVISGDLADDGSLEVYRLLQNFISQLAMPVLLMTGNHDSRKNLLSVFPTLRSGSGATVDYTFQLPGGMIVCLDSQKLGADGGHLSDEQFDWINDTLTQLRDVPAYIFMHHPPFNLGLPLQDCDRLENGEKFLAHLKLHKNVAHLFFGHVHRAVSGTMAGIPYTGIGSALFQVPLPFPQWTWEDFKPTREAASIGIVLVKNGNVIVHFHQLEV
jgi:3',5'-cyclic-AMP phosphodiesterase